MSGVELDISELEQWTEVLGRAPAIARDKARAVVSRGALNVKNDARKNAPRGPHTPHYPASINYDVTSGHSSTAEIVAEIGPAEGRRQWGLGNLLEYGSSHNPPHPHLEPALDREEPRFIAAATALAAEPLEA